MLKYFIVIVYVLSNTFSKVILKYNMFFFFSLTKRSSDSFVELTELVHKGDQRGLFSDKMPARIQREIRENNQRFLRNSGVYNTDYFRFIRELTRVNAVSFVQVPYYLLSLTSYYLYLKLSVIYIFHCLLFVSLTSCNLYL